MNTQAQTVAPDTKPPKGRREFDRANTSRGTETIKLPMDLIKIRPGFNPRELDKPKTQAKIKGLIESYKAGDFVRPIEVAFAKTHYEIVDGECRFTAAQAAGMKELEVYPLNDISEADRLVITINGNQGETLTPMEMADVVERLIAMGLKRQEVATKLHKTVGWIDRLIVLSKIHQDVRKLVNQDRLSMDVAVKVYQSDKAEGKLEARKFILELMEHYKDRIAEAEKNADPDAITNGDESGVKVTMRDYLDYVAYLKGGRRAEDQAAQGAGEGAGEGEGEGEGSGGETEPTEPKGRHESPSARRLSLAEELAFALPDDYGVRKSAIRKTADYTVTITGAALLALMKLQDDFVGEAKAEEEERAAKEAAKEQERLAKEREKAEKEAAKQKAKDAAAKKAKEGKKAKAPPKNSGKGKSKSKSKAKPV